MGLFSFNAVNYNKSLFTNIVEGARKGAVDGFFIGAGGVVVIVGLAGFNGGLERIWRVFGGTPKWPLYPEDRSLPEFKDVKYLDIPPALLFGAILGVSVLGGTVLGAVNTGLRRRFVQNPNPPGGVQRQHQQ